MIADTIVCIIIFTAIVFALKSALKKKGGCCDSGRCGGCCHCRSKK